MRRAGKILLSKVRAVPHTPFDNGPSQREGSAITTVTDTTPKGIHLEPGCFRASRINRCIHVPAQQATGPQHLNLQDTAAGAERNVAAAIEAVKVAEGDVGKEQLKVKCLERVIGKGRNLTAHEYAGLLAATDQHTADFIKKTTTAKPFSMQKVELRLKKAKLKLEDAEQELKDARQELEKAEERRNIIENTPYEWDAALTLKKRLGRGPGAHLLGSLKGQSKGLSEIKEGYKILARQRGLVRSKKDVPIIACASISGVGKTEMLTHVVNAHGHFADGDNSEADEILNIINEESPEGATPLTKLETFFCSFNGASKYSSDEGPVIELTMVERMLRTYSGNKSFNYSENMSFDVGIYTLIDRIPHDVGVIMCLDEIALLDDKPRRVLLVHVMSFCEALLDRGRFVAFVATSLYFHVWNTSVYGDYIRRTIHPFTLQALPEDESLLLGIREVLIDKYLKTQEHPEDDFAVNVIARLLSQECKPQQWVTYFDTFRTLVHPTPTTIAPEDGLDESTVFEWIAPAIVGKPCAMVRFATNTKLIMGLQNRYGEYVISRLGTEADTLQGEMRLPAVRFLHLSWENNKYVRSWTQRALAECMSAQSVMELRKRWELGTIALLEVWRCAMRAVDRSAVFHLKDLPIFRNWDVQNNQSKCVVRLTDSHLMNEALPNKPLPLTKEEGAFGVWHSPSDKTPAIGGTVCFSTTLRLAYQMRLLESAISASKLSIWCKRFKDHEASDSIQIYLLFVTNVSTADLGLMLDSIPDNFLPRNLIIVTEPAVMDLVRPFGAGTVASFLHR